MATLQPTAPASSADKPDRPGPPQQRGPRSWLEERLALDARDPTPLADAASFWRAIAQAATVLMAILAFGVFLFFAGKLVVPILAAIAVGMTFGPVIRYHQKPRRARLGDGGRGPAVADRSHECRRHNAGELRSRN